MQETEYEESHVKLIRVYLFEEGMEGISTYSIGMNLETPEKLELDPRKIVTFLEDNNWKITKGAMVVVSHFERLADWYNYHIDVGDWYLDGCDYGNTPKMPEELVFIAR